jgi:hypothetical protein
VRAIKAGEQYSFTKPFHDEELLDAIQCSTCCHAGNNIQKKQASESPVVSICDKRGTRAINTDRPNPVLLLPKLAAAI